MEQSELEAMVLEMKDKLDNILNTVDESEKKYQHDVGVKDFTERNGESLGKYADKLKKLNGDDFDIFESAYDEYHNTFSDIEESTYVAQLVSEIDNKIAKLKEALGDDEVEIKSDENTTEVKTDDTTVETNAETENRGEVEGNDATESENDDNSEDGEKIDEVAEFEKELEADLDKYKK
jgi:hypothetical protein